MKLTIKEAKDVIYDNSENFSLVSGTEKIIDQSRWTTYKEAIFMYSPPKSCAKYYKFTWACGSTEYQDNTEPFDDDDYYTPIEVELKEVTVKQWIPVV